MIDDARLDAAMLAADPTLKAKRAHAEANGSFAGEIRALEDAARVRVRRVVAALNGIDVENDCSPWTEPPAMVGRRTVEALKAALLNETTYAAVESEIGTEGAVALMGEIASL